MSKPSAEGKLVFTMPRRSQKSDKFQFIKMDLNKIIFLMMLCVPMFVGAQTLTFTDHEPMGNMRTQVTRQFFRLVEQESKGRIRIDHHWNGELSSSYDAYETVREGTKADMATVVPEYDSQRMPLHQLFKSFLAGPVLALSPQRAARCHELADVNPGSRGCDSAAAQPCSRMAGRCPLKEMIDNRL